eukprot:21073-Heterococcus_DN1.PRE.3
MARGDSTSNTCSTMQCAALQYGTAPLQSRAAVCGITECFTPKGDAILLVVHHGPTKMQHCDIYIYITPSQILPCSGALCKHQSALSSAQQCHWQPRELPVSGERLLTVAASSSTAQGPHHEDRSCGKHCSLDTHHLPVATVANAAAAVVSAIAVTAIGVTAYTDSLDKHHYKELVIAGRNGHTQEHEGVKAH